MDEKYVWYTAYITRKDAILDSDYFESDEAEIDDHFLQYCEKLNIHYESDGLIYVGNNVIGNVKITFTKSINGDCSITIDHYNIFERCVHYIKSLCVNILNIFIESK